MSWLLEFGRISVLANLVLLLALGYVWIRSYRSTRALYPLALSLFAGLLVVQNIVWLYLYSLHSGYIYWFLDVDVNLQMALVSLCALETAALLALGYLTLR